MSDGDVIMTNCIVPRDQWYMTSIIQWKTPQGTVTNCATYCPAKSLRRQTRDTFLIVLMTGVSYRRISFEYIETTRSAFILFRVFHSFPLHLLNLLRILCILPHQNADCKYYASLRIWRRDPSRDKLETRIFEFFICSASKNTSHVIIQIFHYFVIYSLPKFRLYYLGDELFYPQASEVRVLHYQPSCHLC